MSRALKSPPIRTRRSPSSAYRRLNRNADHTERNKRRVAAFFVVLTVLAAIGSTAAALAPVFLGSTFPR